MRDTRSQRKIRPQTRRGTAAATLLAIPVALTLGLSPALGETVSSPQASDTSAAQNAPGTPVNTGENETTTGSKTNDLYHEIKRISDWQDIYPDIYASYMSGANVIKDEPSKGTDVTQRSHSHAVLDETFSLICQQYSERGPYRTSCLQCHSTDQHRYYAEYGDDAFNTQLGGWDILYTDLHETGRDVEFWGCYQCHENDPENTLRATNIMWNNAKTQSYDFAPGDAVCGQCHSIPFTDNVNDLYRYGIDADSVAQAELEDYGFLMSVCADVETFQGSTHQQLGLTCTSCHMPEITKEDGTTYTSHDASGSPLEKKESLDLCLTCHESQGITSHEEMISFVEDKQANLAQEQNELRTSLAELDGIIDSMKAQADAGASVDEALLADLEDASMWADYYLGWTIGGATTDGTLAPHNYTYLMELLDKGDKLVDNALALL